METNKTRLQVIQEQLSEKMTRAILEAIESGAKYETGTEGGVRIDGVYLTPKYSSNYHGLVLQIDAPEIEQLFEPTKEQLQKRAEALRTELTEIENKLNLK